MRSFAVQEFLLSRLADRADDVLVSRAARWLRRQPNVAMRDMARRLEVSERHLTRVFRAALGATPKQFARVARISKVVAAARRGTASWAQIALDCGYADQSHRVHEFRAMVGVSPAALLRTTSLRMLAPATGSSPESDFCNTFLSAWPTLAWQGEAHGAAEPSPCGGHDAARSIYEDSSALGRPATGL